jgi:DNA-directed RNA polymerase specialized sigma24 family protein
MDIDNDFIYFVGDDDLDKHIELSDNQPSLEGRMMMLDEAMEELSKMSTIRQITTLARFLGLNYHEIGLILGVDSHKRGRRKNT